MKLGPDGSLCRITSSAKDLVNNVRIIKVPDSEPSYRLVVVKSNDEHEELSEKSDEVTSDDELYDVKFPFENVEKDKVIDTKVDKFDKPSETVSEENVKESNHYNRSRPYFKRKNRFNDRRNKNYNNSDRKYKNVSGMERNYNYGNRDFNSAPTHSEAYNASNQHSSDNISPWLIPPPLHTSFTLSPFLHVPLPEKSKCGLLGDHPPYVTPLPQFQLNKQNDNYIHDHNSAFSPMTANNHDSFIHNQNPSYSQMPSNYPSSKQTDNVIRDQNYWKDDYGNYNKNNQYRNERRLNKNNKYRNKSHLNKNNLKTNWNKKPRRHPNVRSNTSYEYRN